MRTLKITDYKYSASDRLLKVDFDFCDEESETSGYVMIKNPSTNILFDIMEAYDSRYPRSIVPLYLKGTEGSSDRY